MKIASIETEQGFLEAMAEAETRPRLYREIAKQYMLKINRSGLSFDRLFFKKILEHLENFEQTWDVLIYCEDHITCASKFKPMIFSRLIKLADDEDACRGILDHDCPKEILKRVQKKLKLIQTFKG